MFHKGFTLLVWDVVLLFFISLTAWIPTPSSLSSKLPTPMTTILFLFSSTITFLNFDTRGINRQAENENVIKKTAPTAMFQVVALFFSFRSLVLS
jgi:hypothetical protein